MLCSSDFANLKTSKRKRVDFFPDSKLAFSTSNFTPMKQISEKKRSKVIVRKMSEKKVGPE